MSKKKREEERRVMAEFNAALEEERKKTADVEEVVEKVGEAPAPDPTKQEIHCRRCKTELTDGVCPVCGYKAYVGMDENKQKKIKGILTVVFFAAFLIMFLITRLK